MKNVRKSIQFIGITFFVLLTLSACGNNKQSTPEEALKNYFSAVQDMEFEKSYEFIVPDTYLLEDLKTRISEESDEDVPEEVGKLKSYQEYTSEVAKLYKKIDYEIVDVVDEELLGHSEVLAFRSYSVRVTVPNIDRITEESAMNSIGTLFGTLFTGEIDSEAYDEIYTNLVEDLKNEEIEEETIEGIIDLNIFLTEEDMAKEDDELDESDFIWGISHMDQNIFEALTPEW